MSKNPINLTVRFLLEIITLASIGAWAKAQFSGAISFIMMILIPLIAAIIWGTFNVKGDPSRSGKAPVPVRGLVRLLIELAIIGFGIWALFSINQPMAGYSVSLRWHTTCFHTTVLSGCLSAKTLIIKYNSGTCPGKKPFSKRI